MTALVGRPEAGAQDTGVASTGIRRTAGLLFWAAMLLAIVAASLAIGAKGLSLPTVLEALVAYDGTEEHVVVHDLRFPRTVVGLLVGAGLGVAGALIQALTRNPLADPGVLGVNAGAGFAVVVGVAVFGVTSIQGYVWFAFLGAVVATVGVYAIGSAGRGSPTPIRLTLAGVALAAVLGGVSNGITLLNPDVFDQMRYWGAGTLAGRTMEMAATVAPFILIGLVLAFVVTRPLNAVALGDDLARSVGSNIRVTRIVVVVAVTLLCGAATAAAGPIGFVGLMVPHVARWTVGPDQRWIVVYSVVLAPIVLLGSDILGRIVASPGELQVGIVTAFVGAPVLIALVRRSKATGL